MLSEYLPTIEGFGVIQGMALLLFLLFFIFLIIWVWKLDKSFISRMEALPLEKSNLKIKLPGEIND